MPQEILYGIFAEIRETRAELKAHRENSDERNRGIHKRLDRFEDHTRSEIKDLRSKMERSKAPTLTTSMTYFLKAVSLLAAHWQVILTVTLIVAGVMMGKSPEAIKAMVKAWAG